jgi:ATP-dependent Clp protease ATP-binding subunit ClpC
MFERFSQDARQVIVLGQSEVMALRHNWVGTEHLLLGLLRLEDRNEAALLGGDRIADLDAARVEVAKICPPGELTGGHLPFTPRTKTILEMSQTSAREEGSAETLARHILLALITEGQGVAVHVLTILGADLPRLAARARAGNS